MIRSFVVGCLVAALVSGCGDDASGSNQPSSPSLDPEESALLYEVNRAREDAGITAALVICTALNESATLHSDDMRDKSYVDEKSPDGKGARERACSAGYSPACGQVAGLAELVAGGIGEGAAVVDKWLQRDDAKAVLVNTGLLVAGVGRAESGDGTVTWTLDLGGIDDPSCD